MVVEDMVKWGQIQIYVFQIEGKGFPDRLDVGYDRKNEVKADSKSLGLSNYLNTYISWSHYFARYYSKYFANRDSFNPYNNAMI